MKLSRLAFSLPVYGELGREADTGGSHLMSPASTILALDLDHVVPDVSRAEIVERTEASSRRDNRRRAGMTDCQIGVLCLIVMNLAAGFGLCVLDYRNRKLQRDLMLSMTRKLYGPADALLEREDG